MGGVVSIRTVTKEVAFRKLVNSALDESTNTRRQKRMWSLAACGIGLDGYDLFIISAALPLIKVYFDIDSPMTIGLLAAAAVLGAVPGAVISGMLSDRFGRRRLLQIDVYLFALSAVLCAIAWNPLSLIMFRFVQGFAVGAEYPISAAVVGETMPRRSRGKWMTGAFAFQAVGMVLAAAVSASILLAAESEGAWRWMLLSAAVPAFVLGIMRRSIPDSPRWLARQGRNREALRSVEWLLGPTVVAGIEHQLARAESVDESEPRVGKFSELLAPKMRRRTVLTAIPWFLMDIGLYGIGLFTPILLAGILVSGASGGSFLKSDFEATASSAFTDLFLVVGFVINILLVERVGRIRLQVAGFVGMTIGLLVVALSSDGSVVPLVLVGFVLFNIFVNAGPNATTYLLPAEVYPTRLRGTGHGFAAACGKFGAAVGTLLLPVVVATVGLDSTMLGIGLLCGVGAVVTAIFRVETKGLALE